MYENAATPVQPIEKPTREADRPKNHGACQRFFSNLLSSSPYGFQSYTIQIGVHVKEIAEAGTVMSKRGIPRPVVGWWQVIKNIRGDNDELIGALDAECDITDASRVNTLVKVLTSEALPMLGEFETADGLREFIIRTNCLVTVSLRNWLDLPPRIATQSE